MLLAFEPQAEEDIAHFAKSAPGLGKKIVRLLEDIQRHPFTGIGKPEALKHQYSGYWSRRISDEHRLIYKVADDTVFILSCRYHYGD